MQLVARTRIGEAQLRAQARGACAPGHVQAVVELGTRLKNMLGRAVPWKTLMFELAFALVTTTDDELKERRKPQTLLTATTES